MPDATPTVADINTAAQFIRDQIKYRPKIGLILGSGLGPLAGEIEDSAIIPYDTIPHFPQSGVAGHAGRLIIGKLQGQAVLAMQGRTHYYEGYTMQTITMPIRVMQVMEIKTLIVTNASGGLNPDFQMGDLMLITDHINLTGLAGHNPLRGPNIDQFGVRFPSMVAPYDLDLQDLARQAAKEIGITLREGIYVNVAGPSFETPAECRMLRLMGADAVGMSTVPEVVVANHAGMRVLGLSGVANMAVMQPTRDVETTHEEVLQGIKMLAQKLTPLANAILTKL